MIVIYKKTEEAKTDVFCKTVVLIIFVELPGVTCSFNKMLEQFF